MEGNSESQNVVEECLTIQNEGMQSVLTIRSNGGPGKPTTPPENLQEYEKKIHTIIKKCNPYLITIEYKETSNLCYQGSPDEYLEELKAGVKVAHNFGIKCTNGGIESDFIALMLYANLIEKGDLENAIKFGNKAFNKIQLKAMQKNMTQKKLKEIFDKGKRFMEVYARSGIDFLNVHWTIEDPEAFEMAVAYLRSQVGIPLISSEIKVPQDSKKVNPLMKTVSKLKFPCAIWFFSVEGNDAGALHDGKKISNLGRKYRSFIKSRYNKQITIIANKISNFVLVKPIIKVINISILKIKQTWKKRTKKKMIILKES